VRLAAKGVGRSGLKQTIYQNLGHPPSTITCAWTFRAVIKIVDTLGGVDVDVRVPTARHQPVRPACTTWTASMRCAMPARAKSTNDFDRGRRQRKVLMALWEQALTVDVVPAPSAELWVTMGDTFKTTCRSKR